MQLNIRGVLRDIEFVGIGYESESVEWYFDDDLSPTEEEVTQDELNHIEQCCRELSFDRSAEIRW